MHRLVRVRGREGEREREQIAIVVYWTDGLEKQAWKWRGGRGDLAVVGFATT